MNNNIETEEKTNKNLFNNEIKVCEIKNKNTSGFVETVKEKKKNMIKSDDNKTKGLRISEKNIKTKEINDNFSSGDLFRNKTRDNVTKKKNNEVNFTDVQNNQHKSNIKSSKVDLYFRNKNNIQDHTTSTSNFTAESDKNKYYKQKKKASFNAETRNNCFQTINIINNNHHNNNNSNSKIRYIRKDYYKNKLTDVNSTTNKSEFKFGINIEKIKNNNDKNISSTSTIENNVDKFRNKNSYNKSNDDTVNNLNISNHLLISNIFGWMKERQSLAIKWLINNGRYNQVGEKQSKYIYCSEYNNSGFIKGENYWKMINNRNRNKDDISCNYNGYNQKSYRNINNFCHYSERNKHYKKNNNSRLSFEDKKVTLNYFDYPQIDGSLYLNSRSKYRHKQKQRFLNTANKEY
ncbi:hypothetical protein FG386_001518 [Cryptosporidium ryanae]|uniref:uncharacterized protein n=1 Tax=Cryptosporidium ryanae TaxID=515981 RepID=UPI00351AA851|nr:hypothetical protein FG386_001518 [Cryptosporidium ryanae]